MHALFVLVIRAERHRHQRNFSRQIVKANADYFIGVEGEGPDVEVFLVSFGPDQLDQTLADRRRMSADSCTADWRTAGICENDHGV